MANKLSFWTWFFIGFGGKAGFRKYISWWILLHITIGVSLALSVNKSLEESANVVLMPLAATLLGLAFAWGGNSHALLQDEIVRDITKNHDNGLEDYCYSYQSSLLMIIICLMFWGICGLGIVDYNWNSKQNPRIYFSLSFIMYCSLSFTVRESWGIVLQAQWLMILKSMAIDLKNKKGS